MSKKYRFVTIGSFLGFALLAQGFFSGTAMASTASLTSFAKAQINIRQADPTARYRYSKRARSTEAVLVSSGSLTSFQKRARNFRDAFKVQLEKMLEERRFGSEKTEKLGIGVPRASDTSYKIRQRRIREAQQQKTLNSIQGRQFNSRQQDIEQASAIRRYALADDHPCANLTRTRLSRCLYYTRVGEPYRLHQIKRKEEVEAAVEEEEVGEDESEMEEE